jgi:hypothetical protein
MKTMTKLIAVLGFSALTIGVAQAPAAGDAPFVRLKQTCAGYARIIKSSPQPDAYTPGSWGSVPPELRKLPPGAEHCGADSRGLKAGSAVILSPLEGDDLGKFYGPLFQQIGCQPLTCRVTKTKIGKKDAQQTSCTCSGKKMLGTVGTDTGAEQFMLSLVRW